MAVSTKPTSAKHRRGQHEAPPELHGPDERDLTATGRGAFGVIAILLAGLGIVSEGRAVPSVESPRPARIVMELSANDPVQLEQQSAADSVTALAALSLIAQLLAWWFPRTPRPARETGSLRDTVDDLVDDIASPLFQTASPIDVLARLEKSLNGLRASADYECAVRSGRAVVDQAILMTQEVRKQFVRRKGVTVEDVAATLRARLPRT